MVIVEEPVVTEDGILRDDQAQCQALLNRITGVDRST